MRKLAVQTESAVGRIHALWTLDGSGALENDAIVRALRDPHAAVRRQAIRMAELRLQNPDLVKALLAMEDETDPQVRFQLVLTLSLLDDDRAFPLLLDAALRHIEDAWFRVAVLTAAADNPGRWFSALMNNTFTPMKDSFAVMNDRFAASDSPGKRDFVRRLASVVGARGDLAEIAGALRTITGRASGDDQSWWRIAALEGLAGGIQRAGKAPFPLGPAEGPLVGLLSQADPAVGAAALELAWRCNLRGSAALRPLVERQRLVAHDGNADLQQRCFAAGMLALSADARVAQDLAELLSSRHPPEVRLAAARALTFARGVDAADEFTQRWREFSASIRDVAAAWFFEDGDRLTRLLDAIQDGKVQAWSLGPGRRSALERHQDARIRERAALLLTATQEPDRQAIYETYLPAIRQQGDAERGLAIFRRHCSECHMIRDTGFEVGPDLLSVSARYKEVLLADILIPNQSIEPGYEEYMIETNDGRILTGVVAKETPSSVTLRRAKGEQDVILRSAIKSIRSLSVSPMPEGLEQEIDIRGMADLISYIKSLGRNSPP